MVLRNFFTLIAIIFLGATAANGQACVIDTNNYSLISPPAEEMPCVERGVPFDGVLQFFTPPDLAGVTIDSIRITTFTNLPAGLTTLCTPVICSMKGNGRACINITGNCTDTAGYYEIIYQGFLYTSQGTAPFTYIRNNYPGILPDFYLNVINPGDSCPNKKEEFPTGIVNATKAGDELFTVFPNPTSGRFNLKLNSVGSTGGQIKVTDVNGRVVFTQGLSTSITATTIDLSNQSKGLYLLEYRTQNTLATRRIVIE